MELWLHVFAHQCGCMESQGKFVSSQVKPWLLLFWLKSVESGVFFRGVGFLFSFFLLSGSLRYLL